jgi:hypothetical protein
MNLTDKQRKTRDGVLKVNAYCGGVASFSNVDSDMLALAIHNEWVECDEEQGCGLTPDHYLDFLRKHPRFRAHGYVVTNKRPDCRVYLSGVVLEYAPTKKEILAFVEHFKDSEQFICTQDSLYCND